MMLVLITTVLSFFLESITSNFILIDSKVLIPLFTIVSLIIIYPYFRSNNTSYFKTCLAVGFMYDIVFTDTVIMNMMIFLLIGYIITKFNYLFTTNAINICIMIPLTITVYRIITYSILCLSGFISFNLENLFTSIYSSILINIIYGMIIYFITNFFARKYRIQKID